MATVRGWSTSRLRDSASEQGQRIERKTDCPRAANAVEVVCSYLRTFYKKIFFLVYQNLLEQRFSELTAGYHLPLPVKHHRPDR